MKKVVLLATAKTLAQHFTGVRDVHKGIGIDFGHYAFQPGQLKPVHHAVNNRFLFLGEGAGAGKIGNSPVQLINNSAADLRGLIGYDNYRLAGVQSCNYHINDFTCYMVVGIFIDITKEVQQQKN